MRSSDEFRATVRLGVRVGRPTVVVHAAEPSVSGSSRVGFVVSKAVGNAVHRNRVKRRLRHLAKSVVADSSTAMYVVVRALPAAASNPDGLANDLQSAWAGAVRRLAERPAAAASGARP